eukprot:5040430-Karenia_brevis.AAC.1
MASSEHVVAKCHGLPLSSKHVVAKCHGLSTSKDHKHVAMNSGCHKPAMPVVIGVIKKSRKP